MERPRPSGRTPGFGPALTVRDICSGCAATYPGMLFAFNIQSRACVSRN